MLCATIPPAPAGVGGQGSNDVGTGVSGGQVLESCWHWTRCTILPWESLGVEGQMMLVWELLGVSKESNDVAVRVAGGE